MASPRRGAKLTLTYNPWPKINRVSPLIIHNLHVKFESDWAKTVVSIVSTRSYTRSAKVDLDLWPHDPKLIGFLLSSSTTYMWNLKVIGQKLWLLSCPRGWVGWNHAPTHEPTHSLTQQLTNGRITISPPTLLRVDNKLYFLTFCKLIMDNFNMPFPSYQMSGDAFNILII